MKAVWNDLLIAESDETICIEFNHYFPPSSVNFDHLQRSEKMTRCANKGGAVWYHVIGNGKRHKDAAWSYPHPMPGAATLKDYVAFWGIVRVVKSDHEKTAFPGAKLLQKIPHLGKTE